MMELHVCNHDGTVLKAFAIGDNVEILIGRDDSCDIKIDNPAISREHCAIEHEGEALIVRDLDSTGGTFINGERILSQQISDGMSIEVGPAVLKFYDAGI